jgi:hypothetical protein
VSLMAFQRKKPAALGIKASFPGFVETALTSLPWLMNFHERSSRPTNRQNDGSRAKTNEVMFRATRSVFGIQPVHDLVEMPFRYGIAKAGFGPQALGILDKKCFASRFH